MNNLPQGHTANTTYSGYSNYITIIHAESIEMETGDLNTALVAGTLSQVTDDYRDFLVMSFLTLRQA